MISFVLVDSPRILRSVSGMLYVVLEGVRLSPGKGGAGVVVEVVETRLRLGSMASPQALPKQQPQVQQGM